MIKKLGALNCLLFLLVVNNSFGQQEAFNWYFGQNAAVNFSTGTPVALFNNAMSAFEGCATISDGQGNLLFYTDGISIWDASHAIMQNGTGLLGSSTSAQSGIIVPKPGSATIYYVFTADASHGANGIVYSEVDMTLNGGLGAVTANKNVSLYAPACEKLCAVSHANNTDFWVVSHESNNQNFVAHRVNATGVVATPVISTVGTAHTSFLGYLKVSPDGTRLASTLHFNDAVEVYDFDRSTGSVSNPMLFSGFSSSNPYGVEFSPDGSKMYVGEEGFSFSNVYQYDLSLGTQAAIDASKNIVGSYNSSIGALQLAVDGIVYVSPFGNNYLGAITVPNAYGAASMFVDSAVFLGTAQCRFGLPNFIASFFNLSNFSFIDRCFGDTTQFFIGGQNPDSVHWDFGDPASGAANTSDSLNPVHYYADTGDYTVTLIAYIDTIIDTIVKVVSIDLTPDVDLGPDTVLCNANLYVFNQNSVIGDLLWNDGDSNSIKVLFNHQSGTYSLFANNNGCTDSDTARVLFVEDTIPILPNDTSICAGDSLQFFFPESDSASYLWQDGSTSANYVVGDTGLYWLEVSTPFCTKRDTFIVSEFSLPDDLLPDDTVVCSGTIIRLDACISGATSYQWNSGANTCNPLFFIGSANTQITYSVDITFANCLFTDTTRVISMPNPPDLFPPEFKACLGDTITLSHPHFEFYNVLWSDSSTGKSLEVTDSGQVWVHLEASGCTNDDTVHINIHPGFSNVLGDDTLLCFADSLLLCPVISGTGTFVWHDFSNDSCYWATSSGTSTLNYVEIQQGNCIGRDSIRVVFANNDSVLLPQDLSLCAGDSLLLSLPVIDSANILWDDSTTLANRTIYTAGTYWVQLWVNGCFLTDTLVVGVDTAIPSLNWNDTTLCFGDSLQLDATTSNVSYLWSDGDTTATNWATVADQGLIWVERTSGGCSYYDSITVDFTIDTGQILPDDAFLCVGQNLVLSLNDTGVTYTWQDTFVGNSYTITMAGQYWVERNENGCINRDSITVSFDSITLPILGADTSLCVLNNLLLDATTTGATYLWSTSATTPSILASNFGTYWVEVSLGACTTRDSIEITQETIIVDVINDTIVCDGDPVTFDATTANATYLWNDNSSQPTLQTSTPGVYWVDVNIDGCIDRDSAEITHTTINTILSISDTVICEGQSATIDATTAGATYLWNDNSTQPVLNVSSAGTYWVQVSIGSCTDSFSATISAVSLPSDLIIPQDTTMCPVDLLIDASSWGQSWQWQDGSTGPGFQVTQAGLYWVIASDPPCVYTDSITITEDCPDTVIPAPLPCHVRIPTAISANNNGINDRFETFITECAIAHYEMQIYNRWGEMVFQTFDPGNYWDATYQGEPVPLAVYVYSLVIIDEEGRRYQKKGNVTVLR